MGNPTYIVAGYIVAIVMGVFGGRALWSAVDTDPRMEALDRTLERCEQAAQTSKYGAAIWAVNQSCAVAESLNDGFPRGPDITPVP